MRPGRIAVFNYTEEKTPPGVGGEINLAVKESKRN